MDRSTSSVTAYAALAAVYFFWGTTYLGIRAALEGFAPLHLISIRFLLSGGILLVAVKLLKMHLPKGRELYLTALFGLIMLGVSNVCLVYAERWIPSGLAALFITTAPFWMVGIQAVVPPREKLYLPALIGIVVGFVGVLVLVAPAALGKPNNQGVLGAFFLLQLSSFCWCFGAIMQRRLKTVAHPVVSGAVQQLAVGIVYAPLALLIQPQPLRFEKGPVLALIWLVLFGSIVGYSAFVYSMEHLPVAVVATHTFINPIVAVFLGWLFYSEPFGMQEGFAMFTVFAGVGLVKYFVRPAPTSVPGPSTKVQRAGA